MADALDTFLRRRHQGAGAFERTWRLIHLWEAIEITLALASLARLQSEREAAEIFKRQREFFHGKSWDPVTEAFKEIPGAADGAIDQWINILDEIAKSEGLPGRFLPALQEYLRTSAIDVRPLTSAWQKTCDVPSDYKSGDTVEIRIAMRYVNAFRNRLAHVPFPHDPLEDVSTALEKATEQLFGLSPSPAAHEKDSKSSPLTGALRRGKCFLRGGQIEYTLDPHDEPGVPSLMFTFPCQKKKDPETWAADSVVHVDPMMRPHVLTRVKGLDVCEYTRFRAEANAVITVRDAQIAKRIAPPEKKDYVSPSAASGSDGDQAGKLAKALEAIRNEDFDAGIEYFSQVVKDRPDYHVGWLRLGHAEREKAARLPDTEKEQARELLDSSIRALKKAAEHMDVGYQALAHYELSKAYFRLMRVDPTRGELRNRVREEAEKASHLSSERKYQTWLDYLGLNAVDAFGSSG